MNILIENGLISKEGKINSVILFGSDYVSKFDSSNLPLSFINNFKKQIQYSLGDLIKKINWRFQRKNKVTQITKDVLEKILKNTLNEITIPVLERISKNLKGIKTNVTKTFPEITKSY